MNISQSGVDLIKRFEGLRLKAYFCPAGILSVGYGSTGRHVTEGLVITERQAEQLLRDDLLRFEEAVRKYALPAKQCEYDAMVSLCFNIGIMAFAKSTLLKLHRAKDRVRAADQFLRWNRAGGRVLPGLTRRRAAERKLYLGDTK